MQPITHRIIVMVDVVGGTDSPATRQDLHEVLRNAFVESAVDFDQCIVEDRGDGALVLVPPDVSKSKLAEVLPERLVAQLRRHNADRAPSERLTLRVGIHAGDVNHAARIIDAAEVRSALAESDGLVALAASDEFYSEVIEQDPAVLPWTYHRIPISLRNSESFVWLRLLGEGASTPAFTATPDDGMLGLIPPEEVDLVRGWLSQIDARQLAAVATRTVGPAIPPLLRDSAWDQFRYLAAFDTASDGDQPALAYVKLLATEVGAELGTALSAWVDRQTRRLGLAPTPAEPPDTREQSLHLTITIEPDAIDPRRCVVTWRRQDDPDRWPPAMGDVREASVDELEDQVSGIVTEAEQAWAGRTADTVIEFILPRSMLTLPVAQWCMERRRPFALDHQLCVRSLERMRATYWHRSWKLRWHAAKDQPVADRIYEFGPEQPERIDVALSDPRWVGLVMGQPPSPVPEPQAGPDALTAALRAGLPFICWHPTARPEDVREHVTWLLGGEHGIADLPERQRAAQAAAAASGGEAVARDLVLLWDDPYRLVDFTTPPMPHTIARIWCPDRERGQVDAPVPVSFRLTGAADSTLEPLRGPIPLRVLLDAADAAVTPVTHVTSLGTDRTTPPVTFTVTPTTSGTNTLTFRVYRDSDSQLLMEITTELPVGEPAGTTVA